jgi:cell division protein FtsI (penicillin-binding protein 3)
LPLAADKVPTKSRKLAALEKILDKVDTTPMEENTVPDLMKLSTREVLRRVRGQEINVKFVGQGLVSEVVPASGSALPEDKNITVILR